MRAAQTILSVGYLCLLGCHKADLPRRFTTEQRLADSYAAWAVSQPRPSPVIVERAEALLAKEPCVGNLDRWFRSYSYNYRPDYIDTDIIDFKLDATGSYGVKPGIKVTEPGALVNIDDRPNNMAFGDYEVKENRIRFAFCNENVRIHAPGGVDNLDTYFGDLDRRRLEHRAGH